MDCPHRSYQNRVDAQTELNAIAKKNRNYFEYMQYALLVFGFIGVMYGMSHYAQDRIKHQDGVTVQMSSTPQKGDR